MTGRINSRFWLVAMFVTVSAVCISVRAADAGLSLPLPEAWLADRAGMLGDQDSREVAATATSLAAELNVPMYVVTIASMSDYGGHGLSIERFARALYEQWGADPDFVARDYWRQGILVIVSRDDRKARIELGASWGGDYNEHCERIMAGVMVPAFRAGDFSSGIRDGVAALAGMGRGEPPPASPEALSWPFVGSLLAGVVGVFLILALVARLLTRLNPPSVRGYNLRDDFDYIDRHGGTVSQSDAFLKPAPGAGGRRAHGGVTFINYDFGGGLGGGFGGGGGGFGGGGGATGSW